MLKKKNHLIFLSLLILGVLLLTSCFLNPPVTEGLLKGQVLVPEGSIQTKDLTGQALPDATVNIIDLSTGEVIATTTTDASGYYQVFVSAGGPYLLEAVKDGVKLQQITPQVEAGIEYDLGITDCSTTALALIVQAMLDAGADLADINLSSIEADPNFDDVVSSVTSIIEAGEDPTASASIEQAVEDFLSPPATTYTVTYDGNGSTSGIVPVDSSSPYEYGATVTVLDNTGTLVKTGYTFAGWNTHAGGNGIDQAVGSTFIMGINDVTLYAKWTSSVHNITRNTYYAVIQTALDDANSGDIIEVGDGIYTGSITFPDGRVIILQSMNGAPSTIIQGNNGLDTVTFNGSLTGTILEGFTITHDEGMTGSGVFINNSNLTINECTISGNTTYSYGGGIYNHGDSALTITSSTISGNTTYSYGGGIANHGDSTLTITSSTISGNTANTYGGGIDNYYSTLTITSSTISGNTANTYGGGIVNYYSALTITSSTISGNTTYSYGGGIYNHSDSILTMASSSISDNIAVYGGGIDNLGALAITSSTISGNNVSQQGGGIYLVDTGTITIGGSSLTDPDNFNTFTDNKKEDIVSAEQHIRDSIGDCHDNYPYNNYNPE